MHVHVEVFLAWLIGWLLLARVPGLPRLERGHVAQGPLTIVIPARNEAHVLPHLLDDLGDHRPPGARVLVVDDHSEDETAAMARRYDFVEVVPAPPLAAGAFGKAGACQVGADLASPGHVAFLDADVRIHGDALERAVAVQARRGGLVSVWPRHEVQRPYEHASALFNLLALMGVGCGSLVPPRRPLGAFGPFMVTSTEAYRQVGGHRAVADEVVEDFALARRYGRAGLAVTNYGGRRDVSFRMYPGGLQSLIDGWTKNFALGAMGSLLRAVLIGVWLAYSIGVFTWAGGIPKTPAVILVALFVLQFWVLFRQVGNFGLVDALLYPFHVLFFLGVFLRSFAHTYLFRRVRWRGRQARLGGDALQVPPPDETGSKRGRG